MYLFSVIKVWGFVVSVYVYMYLSIYFVLRTIVTVFVGINPVILLPLPLQGWDYRNVSDMHFLKNVLDVEPRALCMLAKCSTTELPLHSSRSTWKGRQKWDIEYTEEKHRAMW